MNKVYKEDRIKWIPNGAVIELENGTREERWFFGLFTRTVTNVDEYTIKNMEGRSEFTTEGVVVVHLENNNTLEKRVISVDRNREFKYYIVEDFNVDTKGK
ncbi:hypothetical protein [Bacillus phage YungSlug]|nr:hypothetical protein [Bacillus phage YungSlug]